MRIFLPYRKATILMPSGPSHNPGQNHLFVVLTDPTINDQDSLNSVLLSGISSIHPSVRYDNSCVLRVGDHVFLRHDSFVFYRHARIEPVDHLIRGVNNGRLIPMEPMRDDVFTRVCAGLLASPDTIPRIKRFYRLADEP